MAFSRRDDDQYAGGRLDGRDGSGLDDDEGPPLTLLNSVPVEGGTFYCLARAADDGERMHSDPFRLLLQLSPRAWQGLANAATAWLATARTPTLAPAAAPAPLLPPLPPLAAALNAEATSSLSSALSAAAAGAPPPLALPQSTESPRAGPGAATSGGGGTAARSFLGQGGVAVAARAMGSGSPAEVAVARYLASGGGRVAVEPVLYNGEEVRLYTEDVPHEAGVEPVGVAVTGVDGAHGRLSIEVARSLPLSDAHMAGARLRLGVLVECGPHAPPAVAFTEPFRVRAKPGRRGSVPLALRVPTEYVQLPPTRVAHLRAVLGAGAALRGQLATADAAAVAVPARVLADLAAVPWDGHVAGEAPLVTRRVSDARRRRLSISSAGSADSGGWDHDHSGDGSGAEDGGEPPLSGRGGGGRSGGGGVGGSSSGGGTSSRMAGATTTGGGGVSGSLEAGGGDTGRVNDGDADADAEAVEAAAEAAAAGAMDEEAAADGGAEDDEAGGSDTGGGGGGGVGGDASGDASGHNSESLAALAAMYHTTVTHQRMGRHHAHNAQVLRRRVLVRGPGGRFARLPEELAGMSGAEDSVSAGDNSDAGVAAAAAGASRRAGGGGGGGGSGSKRRREPLPPAYLDADSFVVDENAGMSRVERMTTRRRNPHYSPAATRMADADFVYYTTAHRRTPSAMMAGAAGTSAATVTSPAAREYEYTGHSNGHMAYSNGGHSYSHGSWGSMAGVPGGSGGGTHVAVLTSPTSGEVPGGGTARRFSSLDEPATTPPHGTNTPAFPMVATHRDAPPPLLALGAGATLGGAPAGAAAAAALSGVVLRLAQYRDSLVTARVLPGLDRLDGSPPPGAAGSGDIWGEFSAAAPASVAAAAVASATSTAATAATGRSNGGGSISGRSGGGVPPVSSLSDMSSPPPPPPSVTGSTLPERATSMEELPGTGDSCFLPMDTAAPYYTSPAVVRTRAPTAPPAPDDFYFAAAPADVAPSPPGASISRPAGGGF